MTTNEAKRIILINRLKLVLSEKNRIGKWITQTIGKNDATVSRWFSNTTITPLDDQPSE
jgi:putative transcriptional regulator